MALTKVSTDGVKDDAITKTKIPANQIEASELADNAVDNAAVASNAAIAGSKISPAFSANITTTGNAVIGGTTINTGQDKALSIFGTNGSELKLQATNFGGTAADGGAALTCTFGSLFLTNNNANGDIHFQTKVSGQSTSEKMRLTEAGNLGIGDTSPDRELVVKNASSNATVKIEASNASTSQLFFSDTDAENVAKIGVFHGSGQATSNAMVFELGGSTRMILQTGGGISFNGDTAAANAINDYEEGTFSPSFANVDNSVITVNHYNYTKIGRLVHINAKFTIGSNNDGSGFGFQLPFSQAGSRENVLSAISNRSGSNTAPFAFVINANQSYAYGKELDGFGDSQTAYATFSGNVILVTGTYEST